MDTADQGRFDLEKFDVVQILDRGLLMGRGKSFSPADIRKEDVGDIPLRVVEEFHLGKTLTGVDLERDLQLLDVLVEDL
jgi:hypothetical protein